MGNDKTCNFPKLINSYYKYIISFGEDEAGELYFLATGAASATARAGVVYKIVDPSRRAPPGKCSYKPIPVSVKGKLIHFNHKEEFVINKKPSTTAIPKPKPTKPSTTPTPRPRVPQMTTQRVRTTTTVRPTPPRSRYPPTTLRPRPQFVTTPRPTYWTPAPNSTAKTRGRGKSRRKEGRRGRSRAGAVRLVNADGRKDRGRVEIFFHSEWGTVCDDLFNMKAAAVVCRQLGFPAAVQVAKRAELGAGGIGVSILLDDVECEGTEKTLLHCKHAKTGKHNCSHDEDVGVICGYDEHVVE